MMEKEYRRISDKKRRDTAEGRQHSRQPESARRKAAYARGNGEPTKKEVYEAAKKRDVPGRSKMSKGELMEAVGWSTSR